MTSRHRRIAASIVAAVTALVVGCSAPVAYRPNETAFDGLTQDQRDEAFVDTLRRASKPRIVAAWVDDHSYTYETPLAVRDGWGIPMGYVPRRRTVDFGNVRELRLYDNNAVFVVDNGDRYADKLAFAHREDAERMIDLIGTYRARHLAGVTSPRMHARRPERRPPRYGPPPPYDRRYGAPPPYDPRYGPPPPDERDDGGEPRDDDGGRY